MLLVDDRVSTEPTVAIETGLFRGIELVVSWGRRIHGNYTA
jgi:hypothetical protein